MCPPVNFAIRAGMVHTFSFTPVTFPLLSRAVARALVRVKARRTHEELFDRRPDREAVPLRALRHTVQDETRPHLPLHPLPSWQHERLPQPRHRRQHDQLAHRRRPEQRRWRRRRRERGRRKGKQPGQFRRRFSFQLIDDDGKCTRYAGSNRPIATMTLPAINPLTRRLR